MNYFLIQYEDIPEADFIQAARGQHYHEHWGWSHTLSRSGTHLTMGCLQGLDSFDHPTHDVTDSTLRSVFWKLDKSGSVT